MATGVLGWAEPLGWWSLVAVVVFGIRLVQEHFSPTAVWRSLTGNGGDLLSIAVHGYSTDPPPIGWFPGYPMLIRWTSSVLHLDDRVNDVSVVVALVLTWVTTVLIWEWLAQRGVSLRVRRATLLVWFLSPAGSALFGLPLSEPLFLACGVGALVAVERRRHLLAAVLLAVATYTRFAGVVFVAAAVVRAAEMDGLLVVQDRAGRRGFRMSLHGRRFRPRQMVPFLGLAGAASFFAWSGRVFGDPFAYFEAQKFMVPLAPIESPLSWIHWLFFTHVVRVWDVTTEPEYVIGSFVNAAITVCAVLLVPSVVRRLGASAGVLVAGIVAMVWFAGWDFSSASRYLLPAFPLALVVGEGVLARRRLFVIGVTVGAIAMLLSVRPDSFLAA